ncbi:ATP-binding protein [Mycolicibacterium mucogenicum]|uniref:ATP-binding protein n=1 Tax=Mycolicibacterium TaxID=1866885 RepID=UPI002269C4C1|nr:MULTISPECIES: ATP-binding protein [Mycolicibacterium]MCX8565207.1 ATP-binding protein [Mycolicibacterium mucogenicum]
MIDAQEPATSFTKANISADPVSAALLRDEFAAWLGHTFTLDPGKSNDVILAVYEAMANAADCAYTEAPTAGAMHIHADYNRPQATLTVEVSDDGAWRAPDPQLRGVAHGRGIPLIHALTDRAEITATPTGTRVRLQWRIEAPG